MVSTTSERISNIGELIIIIKNCHGIVSKLLCSLRNNSAEFSIQFICCNYMWLHSSVQFFTALYSSTQLCTGTVQYSSYMNILHYRQPLSLLQPHFTNSLQAACRGELQCVPHWHPRQILLIQCRTILFS